MIYLKVTSIHFCVQISIFLPRSVRNELDYLTTLYPTLGDAYRLKEIFYRCANLKVQLAKRRAIGYRNIKNFINMIFLTCGKLKFDYPHKTL